MNAAKPQLYLASQSPRRRQLLEQLGLRYRALAVEVLEAPQPGETPLQYGLRVAADKARAGWEHAERNLDLPVLGADTEVVVDGVVQGKPADRAHALSMLRGLSGRSHEVITAMVLLDGQRLEHLVSCSQVTFRDVSETEIQAYWDTGEPRGKAGGYAVQGLGAAFVARLEGSYSGVMGLALCELSQLLARFGVDVLRQRG